MTSKTRTLLSSLCLLLLAGLTLAGHSQSVPETSFDAIVIGGGPAGLSSLSGLGRVRRRTALFDSHHYRNAPTRKMHDVIGNDGTPPAQFRAKARQQISNYPSTTFIDRAVTHIQPLITTTSPENKTYTTLFNVTDTTGQSYTTRKVILGTGLVDIMPSTPGVAENFGKGIYWCPWCDGWEHRDQPFGILGSLRHVISAVLEIYTLESDIIAFVNGTWTPAGEDELVAAGYPDWKAQVEAFGVRIENRTIDRIERLQSAEDVDGYQDADIEFDRFRVVFVDGESIIRNAFLGSFDTKQRSSLPARLGLKMLDNKIDTTSYTGMRTSMGGVFAVGDCNSDGSTNVPHAMYSGKRAAVYAHVEMAREESNARIAKRADLSERALEIEAERAMGDEMEQLWRRLKL